MSRPLHRLWDRCTRFVAEVCEGRHATHGLTHMTTVTENALLITYMVADRMAQDASRQAALDPRRCRTSASPLPSRSLTPSPEEVASRLWANGVVESFVRSLEESGQIEAVECVFFSRRDAELACLLHRVALIAMLHDVADHKYDTEEGSLERQVEVFLRTQVIALPAVDDPSSTTVCDGSIDMRRRLLQQFVDHCGASLRERERLQPLTETSSSLELSRMRCHTEGVHLSVGVFDPVCLTDVAASLFQQCDRSPDTEDLRSYVCISASPETLQQEKEEYVRLVLTAITAISFSKEAQRGKRWFESVLQPAYLPSTQSSRGGLTSWILARDIVSDSDKLEAIGEPGLYRCYEFSVSRHRSHHPRNHGGGSVSDPKWERLCESVRNNAPPTVGEGHQDSERLDWLLRRHFLRMVAEHFDEKLKRLKDEFIVTAPGKQMAAGRHAAMESLLHAWEAVGAAPSPLPE